MLTYLWAEQLAERPLLGESMFRDRADQFKTRLKWKVDVDHRGCEKDEYDGLNPLYVIWESPQGLHQGSLRLLPTTGRNMIEEHFSHLLDEQMIATPKRWECSRFCLARHAPRHVAANLMLAAGEAMVGFGVTECMAVFDQRMMRIYRLLGAQPRLIGSTGTGKDFVGIGFRNSPPNTGKQYAKRRACRPKLLQSGLIMPLVALIVKPNWVKCAH